MSMTEHLRSAIAIAMRNIDKMQRMPNLSPIMAFSGGKDSVVMAHLLRTAYGNARLPAIAEISYCFDSHSRYTRRMASRLALDCKFSSRIGDDWLKENAVKVLFQGDTQIKNWFMEHRHRKTIKQAAKDGGHNAIVYGRRLGDNHVPSEAYQTKNEVWQFHPIREFTTVDVWEYMEIHRLERSPIYEYPFGQILGADQWFGLFPHQIVHPTMAGWRTFDTPDAWWTYLTTQHPMIAKYTPYFETEYGELMPNEACWEIVVHMDPTLKRYRQIAEKSFAARWAEMERFAASDLEARAALDKAMVAMPREVIARAIGA